MSSINFFSIIFMRKCDADFYDIHHGIYLDLPTVRTRKRNFWGRIGVYQMPQYYIDVVRLPLQHNKP